MPDAHGSHSRVCWYRETSELTVERQSPAGLDVADFDAGIEAVQVIARIEREQMEPQLGPCPLLDRWQPRTLAGLYKRMIAS